MSLKYDGNAYSANVNCLLNLVSLGKVNRLEVHKIASHFVFIARKSIQPFRVIYANSSLFFAGVEKIRVLVRRHIFWYFWSVRPDLQPDLSVDPHFQGDEKTHFQPASGNPNFV